MFQRPVAVVVICIDQRGSPLRHAAQRKGVYVDVGTAAQTMLLAAHSLGLGAGLVTSFGQAAVGKMLNFPGQLSPESLVCLGYPGPVRPAGMRPRGRTTWRSLTTGAATRLGRTADADASQGLPLLAGDFATTGASASR